MPQYLNLPKEEHAKYLEEECGIIDNDWKAYNARMKEYTRGYFHPEHMVIYYNKEVF